MQPTVKMTWNAYPPTSMTARAIGRLLGAEPASQGSYADIVIVEQASHDGYIDPNALAYFRRAALRAGSTVLVVPSLRTATEVARSEAPRPAHTHVLPTEAGDVGNHVRRVVGGARGGPRDQNPGGWRWSGDDCTALFLRAIGARDAISLREALSLPAVGPHFNGIDPFFAHALLLSGDPDDLYYLLSLLAGGYTDRTHELNRPARELVSAVASRPAALSALGGSWTAKELLGVAEAMRESMAAPIAWGSGAHFRVLVVDDDDTGPAGLPAYAPQLVDIAAACFPAQYELHFWNPKSASAEFLRLCAYRSTESDAARRLQIRSGRVDGARMRELLAQDEPGADVKNQAGFSRTWRLLSQRESGVYVNVPHQELTLEEIATEFVFVLVDQLYRFVKHGAPSGRLLGRMMGPAIVRGLGRALHDIALGAECVSGLPRLVAISRDDDATHIQQALRSGARDYLVKTRLLRLPAVLAGIQLASGSTHEPFHRSFPQLDKLPNETRGLLRRVRIPGERPLHRARDAGSEVVDAPNATIVAELLRNFPKADLHVHAGSCMSQRFLIVASIVSLSRHCAAGKRTGSKEAGHAATEAFGIDVSRMARLLTDIASGGSRKWFWGPSGHVPDTLRPGVLVKLAARPDAWMKEFATTIRSYLKERLSASERECESTDGRRRYQNLRAFLHAELGIKDRLSGEDAEREIARATDLDLAVLAIRFSEELLPRSVARTEPTWSRDDVIRIYILTLAARIGSCTVDGQDLLDQFRGKPIATSAWSAIWAALFGSPADAANQSTQSYRASGWRVPTNRLPQLIVEGAFGGVASTDLGTAQLSFATDPIGYTLATGLRSNDLVQYLEGCEFSGAEHLRHPFLVHLYAQQVLVDMVRSGVMYAELRAAPDGYVEATTAFEFDDVCRCLQEAFSQAQEIMVAAYRDEDLDNAPWLAGVLGSEYGKATLSALLGKNEVGGGTMPRRLPCKVSLIYVGKRHKAIREMILEAAAAAVMRPSGEHTVRSAAEFVERELRRCRVVGFDLAGKEVGNPPERFVDEFGRLSRLHIPLTVHAGENESAQFIEDSILKLRARRIGHGLTLVEDKGLMARVREDRIGVELCPISNFQTSHFTDAQGARPYPLRELLAGGVLVSINTDNPIISHTNLVREYFQASYAWGEGGMPLWEALRIIRMGFVMAFLNQAERRAMLEIAGQSLFDLFSDERVIAVLRNLARAES